MEQMAASYLFILPFRLMDPKLLPKPIANKLKVEWRPVLKAMEAAPELPSLAPNKISSEFINSTFTIATEHLKSNVCSFVWMKYKKHDSWKVSTWSKRVSYQVILSKGTENDIKNLPEETKKNKKRKGAVEAANTLAHLQ